MISEKSVVIFTYRSRGLGISGVQKVPIERGIVALSINKDKVQFTNPLEIQMPEQLNLEIPYVLELMLPDDINPYKLGVNSATLNSDKTSIGLIKRKNERVSLITDCSAFLIFKNEKHKIEKFPFPVKFSGNLNTNGKEASIYLNGLGSIKLDLNSQDFPLSLLGVVEVDYVFDVVGKGVK